ncbi:MAG: tRNA lysidine(34) synthetase TilS [Firmicutes bacterium]|nr:tRNA lysidine(34) synthetase TilS [Bacillota bacterium]
MLKKALGIINGLNGPFAVGCSGGADSMCLLSLCLTAGRRGDLTVINVDHGIRENSAADSAFVRGFCVKNRVKFIGHKIDVPAAAKLSGRSIETEARIERHAIFKEFCEKNGVPLFLAHNKGDNAESVLMHIFRGCGIRGLAGIGERDRYIVRPLIYTEKGEIYEYLRLNGVPYVEDETNGDLNYSRNRIRAIISEAEKSFAGAVGAVASLSDIAKGTLNFIDSHLDESFFKVDSGAVLLDKRALDGFLAGEYVYKAARMAGLAVDLEQKHIAAAIGLAKLKTGRRLDLPHGLRVFNEREVLAFEFYSPIEGIIKDFAADYGEQEFFGMKIKVLPVDLDLFGVALDSSGELHAFKPPKNRLFADLDKLCGAKLRLRQEGDRFHACGGKSKKLKEFFNEKRVPLRVRDKLPLIASDDEVLAILGHRVGERVKVTAKTARVAEIVLQYTTHNEVQF